MRGSAPSCRSVADLRAAVVLLVALCMVALLPTPALATDDDGPELEEAYGAVLLDAAGNVLFEQNGTEIQPPASTTKVMTAMVVLDSGHSLDEDVELFEDDLGDGAQLADYGTGDHATLGELLEVMLVYSGNDAAHNAACHVAGSEEGFSALMNEKARAIGMEHTHFTNSHGMDEDGHYSCALDLARMGRYAMQHYPLIARMVVEEEVTTTVRGEPITLHSTDRLLGTFPGIRGVKSGAVADGYTFVGASGRGDVQLYTGVVGCKTPQGRFDDTAALMDWGYERFGTTPVSRKDWVVRLQPYAFDLGRQVAVAATSDRSATIWQGDGALSSASVLAPPQNLLPTDDLCGWTTWSQRERPAGITFYKTRPAAFRTSAWPAFTRPLFGEVNSLGKDVPHE